MDIPQLSPEDASAKEEAARAKRRGIDADECAEDTRLTARSLAGNDYARAKANCWPRDDRTTFCRAMAGHLSFASAMPDLWRLLVFLRCGPGGCDALFIKDHFGCHSAALGKSMRWHDKVRHLISLQQETAATRQSRQTAWQQVHDEQHKRHGMSLPKAASVQTSDCILVESEGCWQPMLALTCYRPQSE